MQSMPLAEQLTYQRGVTVVKGSRRFGTSLAISSQRRLRRAEEKIRDAVHGRDEHHELSASRAHVCYGGAHRISAADGHAAKLEDLDAFRHSETGRRSIWGESE